MKNLLLTIIMVLGTIVTSFGQNTSDKMTICHIPPGNPDKAHTIIISKSAWKAHKAHGDSMGACNTDDWNNSEKIVICHNGDEGTETITIAKSSWEAHEAHGDSIGECSTDDGNGDDGNNGDDNGDDNSDDNDDDNTGFAVNRIFVPNAFNPESTQISNQRLYVFGNNISTENFLFRVFNRWGLVVYSTQSYSVASQNGWDGTRGGKDVQVGVYTYILSGQYEDGERFEITGTVSLIK